MGQNSYNMDTIIISPYIDSYILTQNMYKYFYVYISLSLTLWLGLLSVILSFSQSTIRSVSSMEEVLYSSLLGTSSIVSSISVRKLVWIGLSRTCSFSGWGSLVGLKRTNLINVYPITPSNPASHHMPMYLGKGFVMVCHPNLTQMRNSVQTIAITTHVWRPSLSHSGSSIKVMKNYH